MNLIRKCPGHCRSAAGSWAEPLCTVHWPLFEQPNVDQSNLQEMPPHEAHDEMLLAAGVTVQARRQGGSLTLKELVLPRPRVETPVTIQERQGGLHTAYCLAR
jgi:hypothetical protein